jgi:outer membrane protein
MKQQTLILILLFLIGKTVFAQESLRLSLGEAQSYALEHNKTLQNAKLDLKISDAKIKESIAQGLPQIEAGIDYTTYFGYEMEFPGFGSGGSVNEMPLEMQLLGLQQTEEYKAVVGRNPNFDGLSYLSNNELSQRFQASMPATTIKMTDASTGKIQLGQLLFSGQYWVGIQTAKLGKKIAEQGLENSIVEVKQNVANSYFMVQMTKKSLEIFEQNIADLKKIEGHTKKMVETGIAEQTDLDQISVQVAMLENSKRTMERAVRLGINLVKFQLGVSAETQLTLTDPFEKLLAETNSKNESSYVFSLEDNILFKMTDTNVKISEKLLKMEKMSYAPTLTGFYAYNQKFLTTGFDMTPNHIAGISMSIPVFSSGKRFQKVAQAKIKLEQSEISKSMVAEQLKMQEQQLKMDLTSALEGYEIQKQNVSVAKRLLENINRKYEQGMVSSLELTQANSNYLQAESNFVQAAFSLMQARLAIDKLYNKL